MFILARAKAVKMCFHYKKLLSQGVGRDVESLKDSVIWDKYRTVDAYIGACTHKAVFFFSSKCHNVREKMLCANNLLHTCWSACSERTSTWIFSIHVTATSCQWDTSQTGSVASAFVNIKNILWPPILCKHTFNFPRSGLVSCLMVLHSLSDYDLSTGWS